MANAMATPPPAFPANESFLGFCEICKERKEKEKLFKNRNCGHSFCFKDCINKHVEAQIKEGLKIVTCPALNCDSVLNLGSFSHLISKDVLHLWEKAISEKPIPNSSTCSKWKGLKDERKDHEIVWPPMVVIQNTRLEKDDNNKWIGMTSQQLLDKFSSYNGIVEARHSCNRQGHFGLSILIFESSVMGYLEAERLHKYFAGKKLGRYAWYNHERVNILPSGERQLYGFIANKGDADRFNKYNSKGLKYEMRSYQEVVVNQLKQMCEDNNHYAKGKAKLKHEIITISEARNNKDGDSEKIEKQEQKQHQQQEQQQRSMKIQDSKSTEGIERPAISRGRVSLSWEIFGGSQETPDVGEQTTYFSKSWKEMAIPVICSAVPIIWKITRNILEPTNISTGAKSSFGPNTQTRFPGGGSKYGKEIKQDRKKTYFTN